MRTDFLYIGLNHVQERIVPATLTANLLTWLGTDEYFTRTDARGAEDVLLDALGVLEQANEDLLTRPRGRPSRGVTNPRSTGVALAPGFVRRTVINPSGRVNELTDGTVCSVDAVTGAEIGP